MICYIIKQANNPNGFANLNAVRDIAYDWVHYYNHYPPHDALGGLPPVNWKQTKQQKEKISNFERYSNGEAYRIIK